MPDEAFETASQLLFSCVFIVIPVMIFLNLASDMCIACSNNGTADGCSCGPERLNELQLKKTGYKRTKHNVKRKKHR